MKGCNQWDNVYSNGYSLMKLANGGTARINECRRIGYKAPSSYISAFYGTKGSYQFSNAQHIFARLTPEGVDAVDVSSQVNPEAMEAHRGEKDFRQFGGNHRWQAEDPSPIQKERNSLLPKSYAGLSTDIWPATSCWWMIFRTAAYFERCPPSMHGWRPDTRCPGLLAHESMIRDGQAFDVPDFGDAPV